MNVTTQPVVTLEEPRVRRRPADVALDYGLYAALVALIVYFSVASPYFWTQANLLNIGLAVSLNGIMAAAMTVALIAGQLDLSIGACLALSAVITAMAIQDLQLPALVAVLLAVGAALVVGLLNSALVIQVGINSIIVTIAVALTVRGVAQILTDGQAVAITDLSLQRFVNSRPLGIPTPLILLVVVFAVLFVLLQYTRTGWHVYAVGGNVIAAIRNGVAAKRIYFGVFLLTAGAAGLCGALSAGRAASGGPFFGATTEFDVLTAVLLGGVGLSGGAGRIERTLAGVLLIGVLNNGLTLLSVDTYVQATVRGAVFLLAVVLGAIAAKRMTR
ncbi:ABC transporter permease [Jiangella alkaliphila]|uniref:Monosaccharide ABC transporter membrane protein, CUT2 family n=1 Tax=Jiangella alkaliphila TaxID=419479 RepID=A0A1H2J5Z2_9ACTN|nr:ABC transporter permease [Jiangella alkaliphila]SDU51819.1 monosaccharide ABC transporter membrane protein, CUT2 family [Jiangella alkaliphila]